MPDSINFFLLPTTAAAFACPYKNNVRGHKNGRGLGYRLAILRRGVKEKSYSVSMGCDVKRERRRRRRLAAPAAPAAIFTARRATSDVSL